MLRQIWQFLVSRIPWKARDPHLPSDDPNPPEWQPPLEWSRREYWGEFLLRVPHRYDVHRWVESMANDPANACALHNIFRREARGVNLRRETLSRFLETLGDVLAEDPSFTGRDAASATWPTEPTVCQRVMTVEDFSSIFAPEFPIFLTGSRTHEVLQDIKDNKLEGHHLPASSDWLSKPAGRRPWWVAPRGDVTLSSAESVRDMLGLSHFSRSAFVVIDYPPDFMSNRRVAAPTVLDARGGAAFRVHMPMPGAQDDGWGRAATLGTFADGAREGVHRYLDALTKDFHLSTTGYLQGAPAIKYPLLYTHLCTTVS